ncbi:MAG TPA: hypothetical protein VH639_04515 [Bryobacteraceae bacterium]|jgi:hypothetical protein
MPCLRFGVPTAWPIQLTGVKELIELFGIDANAIADPNGAAMWD